MIELDHRHQTRQQTSTLRHNIHQTRSRTPQRQQTPNSIFSTTAVRVGFYSNPTIYSDKKHSNSYKQNKQRLTDCITPQNNQKQPNTKASNSNNRRQKKDRKMDRQTDRWTDKQTARTSYFGHYLVSNLIVVGHYLVSNKMWTQNIIEVRVNDAKDFYSVFQVVWTFIVFFRLYGL